MKTLFKPVNLVLTLVSILMTGVCASFVKLDQTEGLVARSYAVWGDWSAHLSMISAFRERGIAWVTGANPLFSEAPFQYPFLSHALTAFFSALTGVHPVDAALILSLVLLFLLPFILFRFYRAFKLTPVASLYAALCFLLIGGFQVFDSSLKSNEPVTNQFEAGSVFTQFILFEFFPQRAFLFATAFALPLLGRLLGAPAGGLRKHAGVLLALAILPLFHLHSWFALGTLLLALLAFPLPQEVLLGNRKKILLAGTAIFAVSGAIAGAILFRHHDHPLHWEPWFPGWAHNPGSGLETASRMNPVWFWLYNTGVFLPLVAAGAFQNRRDAGLRALLAAGTFLFAAASLFKVQPYFYDNLKIFTWSFLFLAPFAGLALEGLHRRFRFAAGALMILQSLSAVSDFRFFAEGSQHTVFFDPIEIQLAKDFKMLRGSADELVLIQPKHNHWVPCLTGNPVVMGYPGWLWSWGIDYHEIESGVQEVLLGGSRAEAALKRFHPKWIILDEREQVRGVNVNLPFFDTRFKKVLQAGPWRVYSTGP